MIQTTDYRRQSSVSVSVSDSLVNRLVDLFCRRYGLIIECYVVLLPYLT